MIAWIAVALLGGAVGLAELVTRYKDQPSDLPGSASFWVYLALNGGASVLAYGLIEMFGWSFGLAAGAPQQTARVLVAGVAAMALFRSSLFTLRMGDQDVSIGPSALLSSLLSVVDRGVDRRNAKRRSKTIGRIMHGVSFARAKVALPAYCLQLMQNVPDDEGRKLRTSIDALAITDMDDKLRSLNLGLLLINTVGPDVLETAVQQLGDDIKPGPLPPAQVPHPAPAPA